MLFVSYAKTEDDVVFALYVLMMSSMVSIAVCIILCLALCYIM